MHLFGYFRNERSNVDNAFHEFLLLYDLFIRKLHVCNFELSSSTHKCNDDNLVLYEVEYGITRRMEIELHDKIRLSK